MAFPQKSGPLTGTERIALYDESNGNVHVTAQQIADLVGASGGNGIFSASNFWDDTVDGSLQPTKGFIEGGRTFLRDTQSLTIYGKLVNPGVVEYDPPTPGSVQFLGISSLNVTAPENSQFFFNDFALNVALPTDGSPTSPQLVFQIAPLFHPTGVQLRSFDLNGENVFGLGNFSTVRGFMVGGTNTMIEGQPANYFIGKNSSAPATDNTVAEVIGRKADGQLVMRTVDSITSTNLPLALANQNVTDSSRIVSGTGSNSFTIQNFSLTTVGGQNVVLNSSSQVSITAGANINLNSTAASNKYILGDGAGNNLPPDFAGSTYLVIDSNGVIGKRALPAGNNNHLFNTDNLTLGGNYVHNGNNNTFRLENLTGFQVAAQSQFNLGADAELIAQTGVYKLGTNVPEDTTGFRFLKYDLATGQVYQEDTVIAADGNGMFTAQNDQTWATNRWNISAATITTLQTSAFSWSIIADNAAYQFTQNYMDVLGSNAQELGSLRVMTDQTEIDKRASIYMGSNLLQDGWRLSAQDNNSGFSLFELTGITGGTPDGAPIVQIVKGTPRAFKIDSSGIWEGTYYASATPISNPASLAGWTSAGQLAPVDIASLPGPTVSWQQSTLETNTTITSTSFTVPLTSESGAGTAFTHSGSGVTVNEDTFVDITASVTFGKAAGGSSGSIVIFNGTAAVATVPFETLGSDGVSVNPIRYMGNATAGQVFTVIVNGIPASDGTLFNARLSIRT